MPEVPVKTVHVAWRWGFVDSVHFNNDDDWMNDDVDVAGIVARFFASPVTQALRELRIGVMRWNFSDQDVPALLKEAAESAVGPHLRAIHVGHFGEDDVDTAMYNPGHLELAKQFPGCSRGRCFRS